jgi:sugar phosphate isomerase/epimerase
MASPPFQDFSRLAVHTVTTRPWTIEEAAANYAAAGLGGITVWRDCLGLDGLGHAAAGRMIRDTGLEIVSYVRGGFFAATDAASRQAAIDDNKRMIDEAAEMGAPLIVLVAGASPEQSMAASRAQIQDGLAAVLPHAEAAGVRLGIEPLHPVYADNRSAVNTLAQANTLAEAFASPALGVVVDVYHLWWDAGLEAEVARCGRNGHLFAFHICDWKTPTEHILLDRGLMGEGCIPVREIRGWVEAAGFGGFVEVEIFSETYWQTDQDDYLRRIQDAYLAHS